MAITSQVMNITPEQAEKFLMRNTSNRSINWARVNAYANDMKSGQWKLNGEAIVFSENGSLRNGQHRLWAIVKSGVTVPIVVIDGVDDNTILYDRGRTRSIVDTITIEGYENKDLVNSYFVAVAKFHYTRQTWAKKIADSQVKEFIKKHADTLLQLREITTKGGKKSGIKCKTAQFHLACLYALESGESFENVSEFATVYRTGMYAGADQTAAIVCRNDAINGNIQTYNVAERLQALKIYEKAIYDFCRHTPRIKSYKNYPVYTYSDNAKFAES